MAGGGENIGMASACANVSALSRLVAAARMAPGSQSNNEKWRGVIGVKMAA
jgi:hypothetical protein